VGFVAGGWAAVGRASDIPPAGCTAETTHLPPSSSDATKAVSRFGAGTQGGTPRTLGQLEPTLGICSQRCGLTASNAADYSSHLDPSASAPASASASAPSDLSLSTSAAQHQHQLHHQPASAYAITNATWLVPRTWCALHSLDHGPRAGCAAGLVTDIPALLSVGT
jgi:hypothetical protein